MVEGVPPAPAGEILAVEQGRESPWGFHRGGAGRRQISAVGELRTGGKQHQSGAETAPAEGMSQLHGSLFRLLRDAVKLFLSPGCIGASFIPCLQAGKPGPASAGTCARPTPLPASGAQCRAVVPRHWPTPWGRPAD